MSESELRKIVFSVLPWAMGFLSILLFILLVREPIYFLFKENSIYYLRDSLYSVPLNHEWTSLSSLPAGGIEVLIRKEDKRFFTHKGYSPFDIHSVFIRALFLQEKMRGASTITQQLARTLFLNRDRTFQRKLREIHIAVALEKTMHKHEILEYYINTVYWGRGFNGIYYASRFHLGKPPEKLNLDEFKYLVSKLIAPDR